MDFSEPRFTTIHHQNVWGEWTLVFESSKLCALRFNGSTSEIHTSELAECAQGRSIQVANITRSELRAYNKAITQLNEYLNGTRKEFSIPIKIYGTEFQTKVWEALLQIPFGKTWSYKQLAEYIGEPKATRAVGGALHSNPLQIVLPCHRVVGKSGDLTGYALGINLKQKLLELEGAMPLTFIE